MNADQRLQELFASLTNFERTRTIDVEWSLDNMHALLRGDGARAAQGTWIQVGGSKGKGTTSLYLEALAMAAGLRTGVFTSPHLQHVTERVRVGGAAIAAADLVAALEPVLVAAARAGRQLSFFEAMTAAAVRVFRAAAVDVAIFEVGLGGRLDATTAVPVEATLITRIELEHTDLLGPDIPSIATEKAHIMRPQVPAWVTPDPRTDALFAAHARAVGADLRPAVDIRDLVDTGDSWRGRLLDGAHASRFVLPGASRFELPALALAYGCLRALCPAREFPLTPVPRPILPGRFEIVLAAEGGEFVLDGAHTVDSSAQVAAELRRRYADRRVAVLYATAVGKRWEAGLSELLPLVERVFVTALEGTACEAPSKVVAWLRTQGVPAEVVDGPAAGLAALARCSEIRLVVGSFYLVGAVRPLLRT